MVEIGLFEAIDSLPQITRYKPDPVPREAIDKMIAAATKAPNGRDFWGVVYETYIVKIIRVSSFGAAILPQ